MLCYLDQYEKHGDVLGEQPTFFAEPEHFRSLSECLSQAKVYLT